MSFQSFPEEQIEELQEALADYIRDYHIKADKERDLLFIRNLLKRQGGTCALKFPCCVCREGNQNLQKLQWEQMTCMYPGMYHALDNFFLVCSMCSKSIKFGRQLFQGRQSFLLNHTRKTHNKQSSQQMKKNGRVFFSQNQS